MTMFGLIDCNNFYVSCERIFNPSLNGKPVVVLSNNDGCVISRSEEAKSLGIKMGEPFFKLTSYIKKSGLICYSSNFPLYGDISARVMDTLRRETPGIEIYSIDEAFMDLRGVCEKDARLLGKSLVSKIRKEIGVPISIGISKTKTLAKIATKMSKKYPATMGFCLIIREEQIAKVLSGFPVEDIWGVGRAYSKMLNQSGVDTAADFLKKSDKWVRQKMGVTGLKCWRELGGTPCISLEESVPDKKQICTSRSFSYDIFDIEEILKAIATFSSYSAEKLRRQNGVCREAIVFLLTNPFREGAEHHNQSVLVTFSDYTDNTLKIASNACYAVREIFREGYGYKKCGVILSSIISKSENIPSLFTPHEELFRESALMNVLDEINEKYGKSSIVTAAAGVERIRANQNLLSKRYTTSWDDIIQVIV